MHTDDSQSTAGDSRHTVVRVAVCVVAVVAVGATLLAAAGAQTTEEPAADALIVEMQENGDAAVTLTIGFDLTDTDQRTDFEAFADSEAQQQAQVDEYQSRLSRVATETSTRTDREMTVTEPTIQTRTTDGGDVGLVVLTAVWEGLAADNGDRLRLGAPFDSGFTADRTLVVRPPEQHQVVTTAPTPDTNAEQLVWDADRSLDSFEVVLGAAERSNTGGDDSGDTTNSAESGSDDASGPGFGVFAVVAAVAAAAVGLRRRV